MSQDVNLSLQLNFTKNLWAPYLSNLNLIFFVLCPFIMTRMVSDERVGGGLRLMLSSPVSSWSFLVSKYLVGLSFVSFFLLISFLGPIVTGFMVDGFYWWEFIGAGLGLFLVVSVYVGVSLFASLVTESVLLSGVISFAICLSLWLVKFLVLAVNTQYVQNLVHQLWIGGHFQNLIMAKLSLNSFLFFVSLISLFLFLSYQVFEGKERG
ncbi:MAG: ABC transporter permease [Bdellovibrionales bacterium]